MERGNRGSRLKVSADADKVEPFLFLLPDGTFSKVTEIYARLSIVDRFLSNFHKPLQRRMLFTKVEDNLPASGVIKHGITGEIFIVGQERVDSDQVKEYERLNVLHLVSNASSVLAEVIKYEKPFGSDPAEMVLTPRSIGKFYISLEYQSSSTEKYSDREQSSRMLFYSSADLLDEGDELCEFEYNNKKWSIKQVFYDSGFASGTLIDTGQNIETYNLVKPVNTYDPVSQSWDFMAGATLLPFSVSEGEDDGDMNVASKPGNLTEKVVYVKAQFKFSSNFNVGAIIQAPDGSTYKVSKFRNNKRSPDLQLTLSKYAQPTTVSS